MRIEHNEFIFNPHLPHLIEVEQIVNEPVESDLGLFQCGCCKLKFELDDMNELNPPVCFSCHGGYLKGSE